MEPWPSPSVGLPSKSGGFDFDVFLSFRGADTRQGFTSHLHKDLNRLGISAVVDSQDLQKGEKINELFRYMEASQHFVPILSKNYVGSKWCLLEAARMVKIAEAAVGEKRRIIPVFYNIDPSELKDDKGSFQVAITEHLKNRKLDDEEAEECRDALRTIGRISGYSPVTDTNRGSAVNEGDLVTCICKRVEGLLGRVPFGNLAIGIDSRIDEVINMLERGSSSVCMIGICGMGGIGKTTTAKAIYDRLHSKFEGSSFIADVRETAKEHKGLPSLQAKIMRDVSNKEYVSLGTVEEGLNMIKQRLRCKRVLIVLDDIDHNDQLNALVGDQVSNRREDLFGLGSKIIVTTRDRAVLSRHGLKTDEIYYPEELKYPWSLKLFRLHAFKHEPPTLYYLELSKKVVEITGGLPLALIVFGPHLAGLSTKEEWEEEMEKLKKDRHKDVLERLKLSYDGLDFKQQQVFLDIVSFVIGSEKEYAMYVWEDCEYFPRNAIRVLQEKSLLSIDDEGRFRMDDQIRDMGRWIVQKEGKHDPALYSRLWDKEDVLKVLDDENGSGKDKIQSIVFSHSWTDNIYKLRHDAFASMSDLRVLHIEGCELGGGLLELPKNLRWLKIQNPSVERLQSVERQQRSTILDILTGQFSIRNIAKANREKSQSKYSRDKVEITPCDDEFSLEKLTVLQLFFCSMLGNILQPTKWVFKRLRVLEATGCSDLVKSLDFSLMPCLVKLVLDCCWGLKRIDESIGHLGKLELLSMKHCRAIKDLPNSICKLSSLQTLNLKNCPVLSALPNRLGDLTVLRVLILDYCWSLEEIPDTITQLNQLQHLSAKGCSRFRNIPLLPSSLLFLDFSGCDSVRVIPDISNLNKLRKLIIDDCRRLVEIPESFGHLEKLAFLRLPECQTIEKLPSSICQLRALQDLNLQSCYSLREIPNSIANLNQLHALNISNCESLQHLPQLPSSLVTLNASCCGDLRQVTDISNLKDLKELNLKRCQNLVDVPGLENLISLRGLHLQFCESLSPSLEERLMQARFEQLIEFRIAGIHDGQYLSFFLPNSSTIHEVRLYWENKRPINEFGRNLKKDVIDRVCLYLEEVKTFSERLVPIQVVSHGGELVLQTVRRAEFYGLNQYSIDLRDEEIQRYFRDGYRKIQIPEFINGVLKFQGGYISFGED